MYFVDLNSSSCEICAYVMCIFLPKQFGYIRSISSLLTHLSMYLEFIALFFVVLIVVLLDVFGSL